MIDEVTTIESGKSRAGRGRRLAAVAGLVGLVGAGSVVAASPAFADSVGSNCSVYHSWTECLSYDYTTGNFGLAATNGYGVSEKETLWFTVNGYKYSDTFTIPSGGTDSFGVHTGSGYACEGIDSVTFYCWQY